MENHEEYDLITRMESSAPYLTPVEYFEGPDVVCCSEVFKKPKRKLCEVPKPPQRGEVRCVRKNRPFCRPCQWEPETNERDILFRPIRWRCKARRKRNPKDQEPSLGAPIGLSKSSFGMKYLESKSADQTLQGFATNLVAFAEYFITPEIEWDEKVLNRILLEGQHLYGESKAKLHEGEKLREASVKRTFTLCGNAFDLLINDPFMVGQVVGQEAAVPNLHWGLLKFFKKFQFCLLQIEKWYTMLWKNADVYFLFDCFGRRCLDLRSDRKHGVAMLICLRQIENVSHLILNLSGVAPENVFLIRNMQVKSLIPCGGGPTPDPVDRSVDFEIKSHDLAIVRATIHLGSLCFKEVRLRHSLPVAICALINAKIDTTPSWNRAVLDKILKLGAHFYKQWTLCDVSVDLSIHDVPKRFGFGQFSVQMVVTVMAECGIWKCTPNYPNSELSQALRRAFGEGSNLLVEIQGRTYAIWNKGKFYYILDPYSHQCSLEKKKVPTASLYMCGSFDKACCIFTQALLELFEESKFIIHIVRILELKELERLGGSSIPCAFIGTPHPDGAQEVVSLNDSVIGADGYVCQAEETPIESDSADLDSPGLSQTRLEDYSDMRREFIEESEEETDEEDDDDFDLNSASENAFNEDFEGTDDEGASRQPAKEKKPKKKAKNRPKETSGTKDRNEKSGSTSADDVETKTKSKKKDKEKTLLRSEEKEEKRNQEKIPDENENQKKINSEAKETDKQKQNENANQREKSRMNKELADIEEDKNQVVITQPEKPNEEHVGTEISREQERIVSPDPEPIDQDSHEGQRTSKTGDTPILRNSTEIPKTSSTPLRRQRHQRRKQQDGDGSSSSDEVPRRGLPVGCKPNSYPGFTVDPQNLAVIGSESGSYESLCNLLRTAFRCSDRILTMTPWGNYVAFRSHGAYFVFDGCTCNLRSIRHMDLNAGTAGLLCFSDLHSLIKYIENGRDVRKPTTYSKRDIVDQICSKYCSR